MTAVTFGATVVGAREVSLGLHAAAGATQARLRALVAHYSMVLSSRVKARASGRPGPNTVTGDYRRSISWAVTQQGTAVVGAVGTNKPQGRRLEFGFHGVDAIGRYYDQPPYPHFGPAFDQTEPEFVRAVEDLAGNVLEALFVHGRIL